MVKTKTKKTTVKSSASRRKVKTTSSSAQSSARLIRKPRAAAIVAQEMDSIYILKLVLYLIVGSQWLRITWHSNTIPLPLGLIVGFLFARSERFQIDRKLEYAMLLMAMFIGFWVLPGIEILF